MNQTETYYASKETTGCIVREKFNLKEYIEETRFPKNDLLFTLGASNEGKTMFSSYLAYMKLVDNIKNNQKTNFTAIGGTEEVNLVIDILKELLLLDYPDMSNMWNGLITFSFVDSSKFDEIVRELNSLNKKSVQGIQRIWYFDDIGTVFVHRTKEIVSFFDKLASEGRHYNITSYFNSQKIKNISDVIFSQVKNFCTIGPLSDAMAKTLVNNGAINLQFPTKTHQNEFFNELRWVNSSGSRNVAIIRKTDNKVFYFKLLENFVKEWERLHKLVKEKRDKEIK
jgi:hypothetical protein